MMKYWLLFSKPSRDWGAGRAAVSSLLLLSSSGPERLLCKRKGGRNGGREREERGKQQEVSAWMVHPARRCAEPQRLKSFQRGDAGSDFQSSFVSEREFLATAFERFSLSRIPVTKTNREVLRHDKDLEQINGFNSSLSTQLQDV